MKLTFLVVLVILLASVTKISAQCEFELVNSKEAGTKQITYSFDLPQMKSWETYYGHNHETFEGKWVEKDAVDTDNNGITEATFTRFDGPVMLFWANRKKERRNIFMEQHPWYDKTTGCLSFVVIDKKAYPPGTEVPIPYGKNGDRYFHWDDLGDKFVLYINYSWFSEEIYDPFIQHSADDGEKWNEEPVEILGSHGWGKIVIDKYDILVSSADDGTKLQLRFGFGAFSKKTGKKIYLDPKDVSSDYVNSKKDGYAIPLEGYKCK